VSAETRSFGLAPALVDLETRRVFASCFQDGRPAPIHLLEGLPDDLVVQRSATGRVVAVKIQWWRGLCGMGGS
jgi:hypothetical protein